jgi:hypothetical protein
MHFTDGPIGVIDAVVRVDDHDHAAEKCNDETCKIAFHEQPPTFIAAANADATVSLAMVVQLDDNLRANGRP